MADRKTIAMIAHDRMKDHIADFTGKHQDVLAQYDIVATGTTGSRILDACPALSVRRMKSGPLGGDQQIGALIAEGMIDALIFFVDPLTPMPHDVDVTARCGGASPGIFRWRSIAPPRSSSWTT